jgi:UDP-glucose 4-epimerase
MRKAIVTGGFGFIGAYLVRRLLNDGWEVTVVDSLVRGDRNRLLDIIDSFEFYDTDIRNEEALVKIFKGSSVVVHLAAINGTENFYNIPELVLDVGLRGILAVVNACRRANVPDLVIASSAEVYQTAPVVPTSEDVPLMLPDSLNPRYSYGASKIISEIIAFNYAREHFDKIQVFRPHNIYGPDMGWKHVIPEFLERAKKIVINETQKQKFPIQGDGKETRAFCFIDDAVEGIIMMYERGKTRQVYHIGNDEEVSIEKLVELVGKTFNANFIIEPSLASIGSTRRRCPDITKIKSLGFLPQTRLSDGINKTAAWYKNRTSQNSKNALL